MAFDKLPSKRKSQHVVDQILNAIRSGLYKVGDKLPAEYEIAEMTGVSRPAVREALGALRLLGIIDSKPGSGTFIQSIQGNVDVTSLAGLGGYPFDALELRVYLEPVAANLVMKDGNKEQMKRIGDQVRKMGAAHGRGDNEAIGKYDRGFHQAIADACGNVLLRDFLNAILAECLDSELGTQLRRAFLVEPRYKAAMLEIHETIYQAMAQGDIGGMQDAFLEHFKQVEDQLLGSGTDERSIRLLTGAYLAKE